MAFQKPSHTFTKIHLKALQTNITQILFALSFTVFINTFNHAQDVPRTKNIISPTRVKDSVKIDADSLQTQRISSIEQDSIKSDSVPLKKGLLEGIVKYKASDYTSINQREEKCTSIIMPKFIIWIWRSRPGISL